jgi:hypothetical protein
MGSDDHQIKIPIKTKITNHRIVIRAQYKHSMIVSNFIRETIGEIDPNFAEILIELF